jgi:3-phenylpropionate/trans-cinnamate dioxygenase ferredoxin reductase subunit
MTAPQRTDVLLIGGGVASASAARALREADFDGSITLVTRELDAPYHRPPGSKELLRGEQTADAALVLPARWYAEHDVDLRTRTSVMHLDSAARTVRLQTKDELVYDRALLATGAMVRRLNVDGSGLRGIHYLRSLRNADAIRRDLDAVGGLDGARVVLVGGSYVGCEVAASLASLGVSCTILMQESEPLERTFGPEIGRWVRKRLEDGGVTVRGGVEVEAFLPAARADDEERVGAVGLVGGASIPADLVVCGVGAQPDVMLGKRAGLDVGETGGIRCDDRLRTSADGIWAAGDVCEYESVVHGGPIRVEHEEVAIQQGIHVARQWLGDDRAYDTVPYFFSDLADWVAIESVGPARRWDRTIVEGSLDGDAFAAWFVEGRHVRGYASINGAGDVDRAAALIQAGEPVDVDALVASQG